MHRDKNVLNYYLKHINNFLPKLKIKLHKDKSKVYPLRNGVNFLGYRIFYHHRLLRKRNIRSFTKKLHENKTLYKKNEITGEQFESRINGWLGYAKFGNSLNLMKRLGIERYIKGNNLTLLPGKAGEK